VNTIKQVLFVALLHICVLSFSQPALVKDVNTVPASILPNNTYDNSFFCECGNFLYFIPKTELGNELWRTDGTEVGTQLLKDIYPGSQDGASSGFVCQNNLLYFGGNNLDNGYEPWVTDGTAEGTHILVDINPGPASSFTSSPMVINGRMYFFSSGSLNPTLYEYSASSTPVLNEIVTFPNSQIYSTIKADNYYYIFLNNYAEDASTQWQIWRTDGTAEGTIKVHEGESYIDYMIPVHDKLFFAYYSNDIYGSMLWVSNGQAKDAVMIKETPWIQSFYAYKDKLIFGTTYSTWVSDGMEEGTIELTSIKSDAGVVYNNLFYATGTNESGRVVLFNTDGTVEGTHVNAELNSGANGFYIASGTIPILNGKFVLPIADAQHGQEPGISDGTQEGTRQIFDIFPGTEDSDARNWATFDDKVFFLADDGRHGSEVWMTDGTAIGTKMVKEIAIGTGDGWSWRDNFFIINDHVNYISDENDLDHKVDFVSIDGNQNATSFHSVLAIEPRPVGVNKNEFYFYDITNFHLNKTNGTEEGTVVVKDYSSLYNSANISYKIGQAGSGVLLNNKLLYLLSGLGGSSPSGNELWATDGTEEGTVMIKDINPGSGAGVYYSQGGAILNNTYFFSGNDGMSGYELWKTDGTEAGTVLVKDINEGTVSSMPLEMIQLGNQTLFSASDGIHGAELWGSDGTAAGTKMIKDIEPTQNGIAPWQFVKLNDLIVFSAYDFINGWTLWKSDGTEEGTSMIKDISPGNGPDQLLMHLTVCGDFVYLNADDGIHGSELWITDGTETGTYLIDVAEGVATSNPTLFTMANGWVYFSANGQLWRTNGTARNTLKVADMTPENMIYHNGWLYFAAASAEYGTEVFKIEVLKENQTINFSPVLVKVLGDSPFAMKVNSTSGLQVSLSTASDKISISDKSVTILKAGSVSIDADQTGNDFYAAAPRVSQTFCINPPKPVITTSNGPTGFVLLTSSIGDGNNWFVNGSTIADANSTTYLAKETGDYSLQISIDDCESEISEVKSVSITGLTKGNSEIKVYPNPASNSLNIYPGTDDLVGIEIMTSKGVMLQQFSNTGASSIDLSSYTSGMYLIKMSTASGIVIKKFVKN
jgi:ELWxxDGT repeat protein